MNANKRFIHWIDKLLEYNYKVHYQTYKKNIGRIIDKISCFPTKYSQYAMAVNFERIILNVKSFYTQVSIQSVNNFIFALNYQI